jgi:uncharacterized heparinase superfamily protein
MAHMWPPSTNWNDGHDERLPREPAHLPMRRLPLYLRTARHLRARHILGRLTLTLRSRALARSGRVPRRYGTPHTTQSVGWPPFTPIDKEAADTPADAEAYARGNFNFLDDPRPLGEPPDWHQEDAPILWRFNLHYFEWAWAFGQSEPAWGRDNFLRMWTTWRRTVPVGDPVAWAPYPTSLRAWVLCSLYASMAEGSPKQREFVECLETHLALLRRMLEVDIEGNHLIKNLKALIGLSVFFNDRRHLRIALETLRRQVARQILPDGGHIERSPSYHCQVLGDLIDIQRLLLASEQPSESFLDQSIAAMRRWLEQMTMPDGSLPLFNDGSPVTRRRLLALGVGQTLYSPLAILATSGFVVAHSERLHLAIDLGAVAPDPIQGHAHSSLLSYELLADGERLIVDTGTSTYAKGVRRTYERSVKAHNTIEVDRQDQIEVWGSFRVGRRARPTLHWVSHSDARTTVIASHDGYRAIHGQPRHTRRWELTRHALRVYDEVTGAGTHEVAGRVHTPHSPESLAARGISIESSSRPRGSTRVIPVELAEAFGRLRPGWAYTSTLTGRLPASVSTLIHLPPERRASASSL